MGVALFNPPPPSLVREGVVRFPPEKGDAQGVVFFRTVMTTFHKHCYIPYNPSLVTKARVLRKNLTFAEKKIWCEILRDKNLQDLKFVRQKPLLNYIVDFYCSELRLVIEIDGDTHAEQEKYDTDRSNKLNEFGVKVIRYVNHDVLNNLAGVYKDLSDNVQKLKTHPPSP